MVILGKLPKKHMSAISIFADFLFTPQLSRYIYIKVSYRKITDYWGMTLIEDYNRRGLPRNFTLHIKNDLCEKETIKTIAHEMVHVKQYAYLELNESMTMWRGKHIDTNKINYSNLPWEIEAFHLSNILMENYNEV
jgi:hypothetical protein